MYYVNEYQVGKEYGGPEEGSWWYDKGTFVKCHLMTPYYVDASEKSLALRHYVLELNAGKHKPDSVLNKCDWTEIRIEEQPGKSFPERIPTYE